jgi:tetratricopeptide (TPR) repeat protein
MNRQARVLFKFISSSSSGGFSALQNVSTQHSYYQRLIYSLLSRSIYTAEGFEYLGRELADIARHANFARQMDAVEQVSQIMLALPISTQLKNVARHYQALCAKQKGDFESTRKLLERVIGEATPQYRARALQVIGATYYEQGKINAALPFYVAAGKAAIDCAPMTLAGSQQMIAIVRSIHGDHKRALDDLERLFPLAQAIGKYYPAFYYDFLNSLAVELGEVGRINEARNICQITLASPFAQAYPQWVETHDEIEAKRTCATPSVVAVSVKPEPRPARELKPATTLAFIPSAREKAFIQTSNAIAVTVIAHFKITESILDRVRHSIIPRGPPAHC